MQSISVESFIEETMKILRLLIAIKNTTRFQSDPIGKVVNLSKKTINKKKYFNF